MYTPSTPAKCTRMVERAEVKGRAAWLMLFVVCCCCQLLYCIVVKTTYVEVFGRLCVTYS